MPVKMRARDVAAQLVAKFPDAPARQLARMLVRDRPRLFTDIEHARGVVRRVLGQQGANKRHNGDHQRAARTQSPAVQPPSHSTAWEPFEIPAKVKRLLILSDIHVPYHATQPIELAIDHGLSAGCDAILLNGDLADFYSISRYDRDPERRDLSLEMEVVGEWLDWLIARTKLPIYYKAGNHEERWDHYLWNKAAELWGLQRLRLPAMLDLAERGIEFIGDQRPIVFSGLPILHGHELPRGMSSPVNMARGVYLRAVHTMLVGHGHRTSQHTEPDFQHTETVCWSTGCLCDLTPAHARINKWNWGFAIVERRRRNRFHVHNLRVSTDGDVRT